MKKFIRKLLFWTFVFFGIKYIFNKFFTKEGDRYELNQESVEELKENLKKAEEKMSELKEILQRKISESEIIPKVKEKVRNVVDDVTESSRREFEENNAFIPVEILDVKDVGERKFERKSKKKSESNSLANAASLSLNSRQSVLLKEITKKRKLNMGEVSRLLPEVSERTLRRDMDRLETIGLIKQVGKTRDSYYEIKKF